MTDKEILAKIYDWIKLSNSRDENPDHTRQRLKDFQAFIEQEWQRQDDRVAVAMYNRNRAYKDHVSSIDEIEARIDDWDGSDPCTNDIKEIERHRALEIGEDGTVTEVK
tara:strand:- start:968 stop:1294 length:327 start_codon:yes stop_codon:yes gene_type:complete